MSKLIAISGGIGAGKSVVSRILNAKGFEVYDCDSRAKILMNSDDAIKRRLANEISAEVIDADGNINRGMLSKIVFSDSDKLYQLNSIVHGAVRDDINRWRHANSGKPALWVESAIIYESGIDCMVDEVWEVVAPVELRVERVMLRSSMTREEVLGRIKAQSLPKSSRHPVEIMIVNDGVEPVLPQVNALIENLL